MAFKDPIKQKEYNRMAAKKTADRNRQLLADIKAINCCQDCGVKYDPCVYEFHHEVPRKRLLSHVGMPTSYILEELERCVILCANCHKMRHKYNKSAPAD